jgi:hypothetical protein
MASKKSFKADINPAMQFISQSQEPTVEEEAAPAPAGKAPEGYKLNPLYVETKSRRLQLLIQPSLHAKLKARAATDSKSINDLVHSIIEAALKED